jgi:hypothetical protein
VLFRSAFAEQVAGGKDDGHATGQIILGDLDCQELFVEAVNHSQSFGVFIGQSIFAMKWVS